MIVISQNGDKITNLFEFSVSQSNQDCIVNTITSELFAKYHDVGDADKAIELFKCVILDHKSTDGIVFRFPLAHEMHRSTEDIIERWYRQ